MIKLGFKVPHSIYVAVSGGVDSMACLDFLRRGGRQVEALYFNHGTQLSLQMEETVKQYCHDHGMKCHVGNISATRPPEMSQEEHWRAERYSFLDRFKDHHVVTCHHLDDNVEQWIFSSLHGNPGLIPAKRQNYIRPFLLSTKNDLTSWAMNKKLDWVEDVSNNDTKYARNYIRHVLMPNALRINPGLQKVIFKKTKQEMSAITF